MSKKLHNPKSNFPSIYVACWLSQVSTKLLSLGAKFLYGRLAQWSNERGQVHRSAPLLAKEIGCSTRQVERYLKELRDCELIETYQCKDGGENYFLFYEHEWMFVPIIDELCYKNPAEQNNITPRHIVGTPPTDTADIIKSELRSLKDNVVSETETTNCDEKEKSKTAEEVDCEEFIQVWNRYVDHPTAKMKRVRVMTSSVTKKISNHIKKIKKFWPELNKLDDYHLLDSVEFTSDLFGFFLEVLLESKWWMITQPTLKLEVLLRESNFESALLFIKAKKIKN